MRLTPIALVSVVLVLAGCSDGAPSSAGDGVPDAGGDVTADAASPDAGNRGLPPDVWLPPTDDASTEPPEDARTPDAGADAGGEVIFDPPDTDGPDTRPDGPPPEIHEVFPTEGVASRPNELTIWGAGFTTDVEVSVGGQRAAEVDVVDEFELIVSIGPLEAGLHAVKVIGPTGTASLDDAYTALARLQIERIEPAGGAQRGGYDVSIVGTGFGETTRVVFGDREAPEVFFHSTTRLSARVPYGPAGAVDVALFDATDFERRRDAFEYLASPRIGSLVPDAVDPAGGTRVGIVGTGLDEGCAVQIGLDEVPIERAEDGTFSFVAPPSPAGRYDVAVDCGERGSDALFDGFSYESPRDFSVTAVSPTIGFSSGGEIVTVAGYELDDVSAILLGDRGARIVEVTSRVVRAVAPPHPSGVVDVVAVRGMEPTMDDVRRLEEGFRYVARPDFAALDPGRGSVDGGWEAALTGAGLDGVDSLRIDGHDVEIVTRSDERIVFRAPRGAPGPAPVVAVLDGLLIDTGLMLRYAGPLRFDGFSPPTGSTGGGTLLYIAGDGFDEACLVRVDGVTAATSLLSSGLLVATTPPHAEGRARVEVVGCRAADEPWIASRAFVYQDPTRRPGGSGGDVIDGEVRVSVRDIRTFDPIEGATVILSIRETHETFCSFDAECEDGQHCSAGVCRTSPHVTRTGEDGLATFVGDEIVGPVTVTAYHPERSAESIVDSLSRDVTVLLSPLPTPPCDPSEPGCTPPEEPIGEIVGFLSGLEKLPGLPLGSIPMARVETTRLTPTFPNPDPGEENELFEDGVFRLTSRLGEVALVAQCGYTFLDTEEFVPLSLGVVRHIHLRPDDPPHRTAVECDIPLTRALTIKLVNAPELVEEDPSTPSATYPVTYRGSVGLDFGGEGHFQSLPPFQGETTTFTGGRYPDRLNGSLEGVVADIRAGAYPGAGTLPRSVSYIDDLRDYRGVIAMPELLPVPRFTVPADGSTELVDGHVEWEMPGDVVPDFYYISASSSFGRWTLLVPGYRNSFDLVDIPPPFDDPETARGTLSIWVQARRLRVFDYADWDRGELGGSNTLAEAVAFERFSFAPADPGGGSTGDP